VAVEDVVDEKADETIAGTVKSAPVLAEIVGREPVADHHVGGPREYVLAQAKGFCCQVGAISIHNDVAVGLYVAKHATNNKALALTVLRDDDSSGLQSERSTAVR